MNVELAKALLERAETLGIKGVKPTVEQGERLVKFYLRAQGYQMDAWENYKDPSDPNKRYHFSTRMCQHQGKGDSGWYNIDTQGSNEVGAKLMMQAATAVGDQKLLGAAVKAKASKEKAKERAVMASHRQEADVVFSHWFALEYREALELTLKGQEIPPDMWTMLEHEKKNSPMRGKALELVQAHHEGGPEPMLPVGDKLGVDTPPLLPILSAKTEYSWLETVDDVEYSIVVANKQPREALIHIGATGGMGLMVDAASLAVVMSHGGDVGDGYVSGRIEWPKGMDHPTGWLFMISAQSKHKGAGARLLSIWCRLMAGYKSKFWVGQAIGEEGQAFLTAMAKRGKIEILKVHGKDAAIRCT